MARTQQAQQQPQQQVATTPKGDDRLMTEFVPFGSKDLVKLSVTMVRNMIAGKTRTGKTCSEDDALKFIMLCKAKRLNPWEGDAFLIGFDTDDGPKFSLIAAHQAFLKRAETHPEYDGMESGTFVKTSEGEILDREGDVLLDDDVLLGGWATIHFKNRKFPMKKRLMFKSRAKPTSVWKSDPAGMIVKCAEADALRSSFPSLLGGLYLDGELSTGGMTGDVITIEPAKTSAKRIADKINGVPEMPMPVVDESEVDEEATAIEETQAAPAAEPARPAGDTTALFEKLAGQIEAAKTKKVLQQDIGTEILRHSEQLGKALTDELLGLQREKMESL